MRVFPRFRGVGNEDSDRLGVDHRLLCQRQNFVAEGGIAVAEIK